MSIKQKIQAIFGTKTKALDLEVRFHKEAIYYGEHGTMVVSHVKQKLVETPVRFVFIGLSTPPRLDRALFNFLWEEAKSQGYIPHHITAYGKENEIVNMPKSTIPKAEATNVLA